MLTQAATAAVHGRHVPLLRVFLSSPSDVHQERAAAERILAELPDRPSFRDRLAVRTVSWSAPTAGTPLLGHLAPQEAINQGLPRPSECDVVVVLLWSRLGTPFTDTFGRTFRSGTHWELLDAIESGHPRTLIYASNRAVHLAANDREAHEQLQALEEFKRSELFYRDGQAVRGINYFGEVDGLRSLLRSHLEEVAHDWLRSVSDVAEAPHTAISQEVTAASSIWEGSPFPGLRAFSVDDAPIYYGRERVTDELRDTVARERFTVVVGTSGSGKSSLVRAGLLPRLFANEIADERTGSKDWTVVPFRPGSDPFAALAAALLREVPELRVADPIDFVERRDRFAANLRHRATYLNETLEVALEGSVDWAQILLVVDQFEELFAGSDESTVEAFTAALRAAGPQVRVLATLRADFYEQALQVLGDELRGGTFSLGTPTEIELLEMIRRPAERAALRFEPGLAEQIVQDTGCDAGVLPLLAYTLDNLYQASRSEGTDLLAAVHYDAMGGVQGAIATRAEAVVAALGLSDDELAELSQRVFFRLVTVNEQGMAVRRPALASEFDDDVRTREFVTRLVDARLLVRTATPQGAPAIEVAHESLFHRWERLAGSIERIQDDLVLLRHVRHAAQEWQRRGENAAFLWSHELLTFVDETLERLGHPALDPVTAAFVRPESSRLLEEIKDPSIGPRRRAWVGERLAQIGDPRAGLGVKDGIPVIEWALITGGPRRIDDQTIEVQDFYMSRYAVTEAQYAAFLAGAVDLGHWWQGLGTGPESLEEQQTAFGNHPRDSVRWADAVAFTTWLHEQLAAAGTGPTEHVRVGEGGWALRLPVEWEWELAAGGPSPGRSFPWGERFATEAANTREAGLSQTCAVGMFPAGRSPQGVEDLSGNIAEWCLNLADDPLVFGGQEHRVHVRKGGSCNHPAEEARTTSRFHGSQHYRFSHDMGFRIVIAQPPTAGRRLP